MLLRIPATILELPNCEGSIFEIDNANVVTASEIFDANSTRFVECSTPLESITLISPFEILTVLLNLT